MPTETQVKRLIADTVFEAHHKLCAVGRLKTKISRERARNIAGVIFDELHRSNGVVIDGKPNLKVITEQREAPVSLRYPEHNLKVMSAERCGPRVSSMAPDPNLKAMTAGRLDPRRVDPKDPDVITAEQRDPPGVHSFTRLARTLLDEQ